MEERTERRMRIGWKTWIRGGIVFALIYAVIHYWDAVFSEAGKAVSAAKPLLLGLVAAYVINILMSFYEKKYAQLHRGKNASRWQRPICLGLALLTIVLSLLILCRMLLPELVRCIRTFCDTLPESLDAAVIWIQEHWEPGDALLTASGYLIDGDMDWETIWKDCSDCLFGDGGWSMSSVVEYLSEPIGGIATIAIAVVFAVYLLRKERLLADARYLLGLFVKKRTLAMSLYIFRALNEAFHHYIVGQCLEAVVLGSLCIVGMLILGLPYATMIGSLVGFTALIPLAGAYIGAAVGALMIFTVSSSQAIFFLIFLVILQQVENNLIYPRVVGASIGLPGIWVFAAVVIGAGTGGIAGMLLAVPLTAAAYSVFREIFWKQWE